MFCPLCESEFRDSFTQCSDCRIPLVPTAAEARGKSAELWRGDSQERLERILAALSAVEIAAHFTEGVDRMPSFKFSYIFIRPKLDLRIIVLRDDLAKSRDLLRQMDEADRKEFEED